MLKEIRDLKTIKINGKFYCLSDELLVESPSTFSGCKTTRALINKKKLVEIDDYIFARLKDNEWVQSNGRGTKVDKVFMRKSWVLENVPEYNKALQEDQIKEAPPLIELEDHEKFVDDKGNYMEIEVRGERKENKCYFKVGDVGTAFNMNNLHNTILNTKDGTYKRDIDYVKFMCPAEKNEHKRLMRLFLTFRGLLRVLNTARNGKTAHYLDKITTTSFASLFGTNEDKINAAADIVNASPKAIKNVLKCSAQSTSCIYLLKIGKANNLKEELGSKKIYKKNEYICKFGQTRGLSRRALEHDGTYKGFNQAKLELIYFHLVHVDYIVKAESDLKKLLKNTTFKVDADHFNELISCTPSQLPEIKNLIDTACKAYSEYAEDIFDQLRNKDTELLKKDLYIKEMELGIKDEKFEMELEMKEKDTKIMELEYKYKLLELEHKLKHFETKNIKNATEK